MIALRPGRGDDPWLSLSDLEGIFQLGKEDSIDKSLRNILLPLPPPRTWCLPLLPFFCLLTNEFPCAFAVSGFPSSFLRFVPVSTRD